MGFLANGAFAPSKNMGGLDESGENDECAFCPQKQGFALQKTQPSTE